MDIRSRALTPSSELEKLQRASSGIKLIPKKKKFHVFMYIGKYVYMLC